MSSDLEGRLARFVEHHVLRGETLDLDVLCSDRPDLRVPLQALVSEYLTLAGGEAPQALPSFEGFQTIERLGAGGMGEVYKLRDLKLDRIVAGKIVRRDRGAAAAEFLREARAMALFSDPRIARIFEFRHGGTALI